MHTSRSILLKMAVLSLLELFKNTNIAIITTLDVNTFLIQTMVIYLYVNRFHSSGVNSSKFNFVELFLFKLIVNL